MRILVSFVLGVLVGAGGLFAWLRQLPADTPPPVVSASGGALPAPPPSKPADPLAGQLPPPPAVQPQVTEADLPPAPAPASPALAQVPQLPAATGTGTGRLLVPVEGVKPAQLTDTFNQPRGKERQHHALDIMAPKGTPVLAAADGKVVKLFTSKRGGLTVYQFDPTSTYAYYYAHLDRYAPGLKEGMVLKRGDPVGFVGSSGDASPDAPHLHFEVIELTPEKQWWKGKSIDPYPLLVD